MSWEKRTSDIAPTPKAAHPISELAALPGSPDNVIVAPVTTIGDDEARRLNAAVPFASTAGEPARQFHAGASPADRTRATDCLAIAAMAEAGGDDIGQRAVIQVILNRVVHPAFAKTVCGVVFEGSHRATGCQFSFTCDGSLARRYSDAAWARARQRASEALDGWVYAPVGLSTHYHTDWVHPYWSDALAKIGRVDTHLFFRWRGYWGSPAAFTVAYRGGEPAITQLSYLPAHSAAAAAIDPQAVDQTAPEATLGDVVVRNADGGAFVLLTGLPSATAARDMGRSICMDRPSCKVFGWFDRAAIPAAYPVPARARGQLGFSYFRDAHADEIVLYDCARFTSVSGDACMPIVAPRQAVIGTTSDLSPLVTTALKKEAGKDALSTLIGRDARPPAPTNETL